MDSIDMDRLMGKTDPIQELMTGGIDDMYVSIVANRIKSYTVNIEKGTIRIKIDNKIKVIPKDSIVGSINEWTIANYLVKKNRLI